MSYFLIEKVKNLSKNNIKFKIFIFFISGFILGSISVYLYFDNKIDQFKVSPIRLGEDKLINPLIAVETPEIVSSDEFNDLKKKVLNLINDLENSGKIDTASVYFKDSKEGDWFGINLDESYHPASLLKIPTLVAYYKIAESDPSILNKRFVLNLEKDYQEMESIKGSKRAVLGNEYSVNELIEYMIKYSDNNAGIFLSSVLNQKFFNEVFSDLGLDVPYSRETTINPKSFSIFFRTLYNTTYLNKKMSEKALELLSISEFDKGLKAGVPKDVTVSHKFGEFGETNADGSYKYRELHDCGMVYAPTDPYLICVMTKGKNLDDLFYSISQISKVVFEEVNNN